ncbi:hypothetical protein NG895_29025 [Aeoliella sp. ICT_H6.2]|uniref:Leucine Rich repeats (2 copies) n=1 Tax=Aeoliella straminimaris TaxID=2954799 RepID=A0A9X2JJA4_9BACT|nr:hypothetical protein [Aeoliella straminimaris]MCO6047965.1 hypothetical protein [Aeoliella straminimaris]
MQWKLRFSLRTWFLLFTVVALASFWHLGGAVRQKQAVGRVHLLAGYGMNPDEWANFTKRPVQFDVYDQANPPQTLGERVQQQLCQYIGYEYFGTVSEISLTDAPLEADDLTLLAELPDLRSLNLTGASIDDDAMVHVARCKSLEKLSIAYTPITDEGCKRLASLARLQELDIRGTRISAASLPVLQAMPNLKQVKAEHLDIRDARGLRQGVVSPGR